MLAELKILLSKKISLGRERDFSRYFTQIWRNCWNWHCFSNAFDQKKKKRLL